jgi:hypothetical protein
MCSPLSEWKEETAADLDEAESRLDEVASTLSGDPTAGQMRSIWLAYLKVEKSVAFVKVDLDEENPGRFVDTRAYRVPDERQALLFALRNLRRGSQRFQSGDLKGALADLRESRNYLRVLLKEKQRIRARRARGAQSD